MYFWKKRSKTRHMQYLPTWNKAPWCCIFLTSIVYLKGNSSFYFLSSREKFSIRQCKSDKEGKFTLNGLFTELMKVLGEYLVWFVCLCVELDLMNMRYISHEIVNQKHLTFWEMITLTERLMFHFLDSCVIYREFTFCNIIRWRCMPYSVPCKVFRG